MSAGPWTTKIGGAPASAFVASSARVVGAQLPRAAEVTSELSDTLGGVALGKALRRDPRLDKLPEPVQAQLGAAARQLPARTRSGLLRLVTDRSFANLSAKVQRESIAAVRQSPVDESHTTSLLRLVRSKPFRELDDDVQSQVVRVLGKLPQADVRQRLCDIFTRPSFGMLRLDQQRLVVDIVAHGGLARLDAVVGLLDEGAFFRLDPEVRTHGLQILAAGVLEPMQRLLVLRDFCALTPRAQHGLLAVLTGPTADPETLKYLGEEITAFQSGTNWTGRGSDRRKYTLGELIYYAVFAPHFATTGQSLRARRAVVTPKGEHEYDVQVGGLHVPLHYEAPRAGLGVSLAEAVDSLARMPELALRCVKRVVVVPEPGPAFMAATPDGTLWMGPVINAAGYVILNPDGTVTAPTGADQKRPPAAFTALHEGGHLFSFRALGEESSAEWKAWQAAMAAEVSPPSGYATRSTWEDFAETWVLYWQSKGTPLADVVREIHPLRFQLIDDAIARFRKRYPGEASVFG